MHVQFWSEEGVVMANGGRCLGFVETGWLRTWMQPLSAVSHKGRDGPFCLLIALLNAFI